MYLQELETKKETLLIALQDEKNKEQEKDLQYQLQLIEQDLTNKWNSLLPSDRVYLARKKNRPNITFYIEHLFTDFFEQKGDRTHLEDPSILGGIAFFHEIPVTVLGHRKGKTLEENLLYRFGMPSPEGYRKAIRIMKQAEKFGRPIITFVDTPGAYPGIEAEESGQGEAIARCIMEMSELSVPVISITTGEGGSGGALALSVANRLFMLENAVYSVLSPEGFASILWKDSSRQQEACELMKLTAQDLYKNEIIEKIIPENKGGIEKNTTSVLQEIDSLLLTTLNELRSLSKTELIEDRWNKFRKIGL